RGALVRAMGDLAAAGPQLRLERPEKLHVTVAYLGKVDTQRLDAFEDALARAADACPPFAIEFDCLGPFGDSRKPRIIALRCSRPQPGFAACAAAVRAQYEALGVVFEHEALAHVTVARARNGLGTLARIETELPCILAVRELALFESVPAGPTTRYERRSTAPLQTTRSRR
ncbi:MAG: RNA 2',3'-cyclic phosphodiesterase, partial [Candidatus Eremiobacteraeota bacterium]|nr:RNA 2',3'-cyclic phosphodiesterase [Candidatus Eremiobacteraeota bacterium]